MTSPSLSAHSPQDDSVPEPAARSHVSREPQTDATGRLTKLELTSLGRRPYSCPEVVSAWWRLRSTHDSVNRLFDTLYLVRRTGAAQRNVSTRGRLTEDAQDLLRAAIVFTSAGLDACLSALIEDAVPILVAYNTAACHKFERFIDDTVNSPKVYEEFKIALKAPHPRESMLKLYKDQLTKSSFQGRRDVKDRACAALGIANSQLNPGRMDKLDSFFTARNDVAHRLDHQPDLVRSDVKPPRQQRRQDDVLENCDNVLIIARELVRATADNLATRNR